MDNLNDLIDIYADGLQVVLTQYGATITLSLSEHSISGGHQDVPFAKVRLSLELAKVLSMILRRDMRNYEDASGTKVMISSNILNNIGMSIEDL